MRRLYCEWGPSAGRNPITRRRIANRKSTKHQLLHAIQHRRNQKPTGARLLGPNEPEITQTKKEVQDCLPGESDCRISAPIPCPLLSAMGSGCSPESPTRSSSSAPLRSLEQLVHVAWSAVHTCESCDTGSGPDPPPAATGG